MKWSCNQPLSTKFQCKLNTLWQYVAGKWIFGANHIALTRYLPERNVFRYNQHITDLTHRGGIQELSKHIYVEIGLEVS